MIPENTDTPLKADCPSAPCSALLAWIERHRIQIDIDYSYGGKWWRIYVADPGGHYMEDRIKVLGSAPTVAEAIQKAIKNNPERYSFPLPNDQVEARRK